MKILILTFILFIETLAQTKTFTLKSNDLTGQATEKFIFNSFGCIGENNSPHLFWENAPIETKSFAVTMYDEDAPTGSGWWHWIIFDIPVNVSQLVSNAGNLALKKAPEKSIQSKTDYGISGYGGPCPPEGHGFHKYTITVYALNSETLGLNTDANPALVGFYLEKNVLAKSSLVFYHKR